MDSNSTNDIGLWRRVLGSIRRAKDAFLPPGDIGNEDIVPRTFAALTKDRTERLIALRQPVLSVCAVDEDWHRSREGYMTYDKVRTCRFGPNAWIVSLGTPSGNHPSDAYHGDIAAIPIDMATLRSPNEQVAEVFRGNIRSFFRDSVLIVSKWRGLDRELSLPFADGWDGLPNRYYSEFRSTLFPAMRSAVAAHTIGDEKPKVESPPDITQYTRYRPELPATLANIIAAALSER